MQSRTIRCWITWSPPSRWSGLKSLLLLLQRIVCMSPPSRWSGLKFWYPKWEGDDCPSPPSRWSGLKWFIISIWIYAVNVSTLAVEWIEIAKQGDKETTVSSPPSRWSGLKYSHCSQLQPFPLSPPSRWSGLKFSPARNRRIRREVSTLAVEWIEIIHRIQ